MFIRPIKISLVTFKLYTFKLVNTVKMTSVMGQKINHLLRLSHKTRKVLFHINLKI